jgi:hypothetical protein
LLFCFAALSFAGDGTALPAWIQSAFIAATLIGLYLVARLFVNPQSRPIADSGAIATAG